MNGPTAAVVIFVLLMCVKRLLLSLTPSLRYDTHTHTHTHTKAKQSKGLRICHYWSRPPSRCAPGKRAPLSHCGPAHRATMPQPRPGQSSGKSSRQEHRRVWASDPVRQTPDLGIPPEVNDAEPCRPDCHLCPPACARYPLVQLGGLRQRGVKQLAQGRTHR